VRRAHRRSEKSLTVFICNIHSLYGANMIHPPSDDLALRLTEAIHALVRRFSLAERADVACCGMTVAQAATWPTAVSGSVNLGYDSGSLRAPSRAIWTALWSAEWWSADPTSTTVAPCARSSPPPVDGPPHRFGNRRSSFQGPSSTNSRRRQLQQRYPPSKNSSPPGAFDHLSSASGIETSKRSTRSHP